MCVRVYLFLCCPVFRSRPCDELIPRPRSNIACEKIKKLSNQPCAPIWERAPEYGGKRKKIHSHNFGLQAIQRYRWSTHFPVHRYTRTRVLSLH
jgi:hypothetical protein